MATAKEIRDAVEARLASLWTNIVSRQATYFAANGRYFQGLVTHAAIPAEGASAAANRLTSKPTDQAETWQAFGITSHTEAFALMIDTYDGPSGKGFVATAFVKIGGKVFRRSKGHGPEARDKPWAEIQ